jgi:phage shock protein PspC (stress-responsive transcriptional regulator)
MRPIIQPIFDFFERQAFGVCTWLGDKLHMPGSRIRLFFVYASFITLGSPLIVYLHMAFILRLKEYIKARKTQAWDL